MFVEGITDFNGEIMNEKSSTTLLYGGTITAARIESTNLASYRLKEKLNDTYVLQGAYVWSQGS